MRVIAGEARGIRLDAPKGEVVRPTSDRVRESMFNALGSLGLPGDASVIDLFAGTGALGIEALSRGARRVVFVEENRAALECIEANLARAKLSDRAEVVPGPAERAIERLANDTDAPFDLALLDPPYSFAGWAQLLAAVPASLAVIESNRALGELLNRRVDPGVGMVRGAPMTGGADPGNHRAVDPTSDPATGRGIAPEVVDPEIDIVRERTYGSTIVTFVRLPAAEDREFR